MNEQGKLGRSGFHGKIPRHGDFITRQLDAAFVERWDDWLQGVIAESQTILGDRWLDDYLVCPIWRFALAPGVIDTRGWLGALMASVDRVGRYFPLTVALPLAGDDPNVLGALLSRHVDEEWFRPLEEVMLGTLGENGLDATELAHALDALVETVPATVAMLEFAPALQSSRLAQGQRWMWPGETPTDAADLLILGQARALQNAHAPMSAWLSYPGMEREGELCVLTGLPEAKRFASMLRGGRQDRSRAAAVPDVAPARVPETRAASEEVDDYHSLSDDTVPEILHDVTNNNTLDDEVQDELARLLAGTDKI